MPVEVILSQLSHYMPRDSSIASRTAREWCIINIDHLTQQNIPEQFKFPAMEADIPKPTLTHGPRSFPPNPTVNPTYAMCNGNLLANHYSLTKYQHHALILTAAKSRQYISARSTHRTCLETTVPRPIILKCHAHASGTRSRENIVRRTR